MAQAQIIVELGKELVILQQKLNTMKIYKEERKEFLEERKEFLIEKKIFEKYKKKWFLLQGKKEKKLTAWSPFLLQMTTKRIFAVFLTNIIPPMFV